MSNKQMKFKALAHAELKRGVDQIARAVAVTMGPTGRNVIVQKSFGNPSVTKDGVSVAKEVKLTHVSMAVWLFERGELTKVNGNSLSLRLKAPLFIHDLRLREIISCWSIPR